MAHVSLGTCKFNMTSVAETSEYIPESFNLISPPTRGAWKLEPSLFLRRLTNVIVRYIYNISSSQGPKLAGYSLYGMRTVSVYLKEN